MAAGGPFLRRASQEPFPAGLVLFSPAEPVRRRSGQRRAPSAATLRPLLLLSALSCSPSRLSRLEGPAFPAACPERSSAETFCKMLLPPPDCRATGSHGPGHHGAAPCPGACSPGGSRVQAGRSRAVVLPDAGASGRHTERRAGRRPGLPRALTGRSGDPGPAAGVDAVSPGPTPATHSSVSCSADQALAVKTWTLILHLEIIWQLLRNAAPAHVGLVGGCVLTGSPGADASAPAPHARRTWRLLTRLPTCHFPAEEPFRFPSSPKSRAASSKCAPLSGTHLRPPLRALAAPRPHPRVGTPPSRGARVKAASIAVSWPPGRMSPWSCPSRGTDVCGRRSWSWSEAVGVPEGLRTPGAAPALPWSPAAGLPRDTAPAGLRDLARRLLKRD